MAAVGGGGEHTGLAPQRVSCRWVCVSDPRDPPAVGSSAVGSGQTQRRCNEVRAAEPPPRGGCVASRGQANWTFGGGVRPSDLTVDLLVLGFRFGF